MLELLLTWIQQTIELAKLQVGDEQGRDVKLIVSTVAEVEHLLPWLLEVKGQGRGVNVSITSSNCHSSHHAGYDREERGRHGQNLGHSFMIIIS